jgi:hypothetical protein
LSSSRQPGASGDVVAREVGICCSVKGNFHTRVRGA